MNLDDAIRSARAEVVDPGDAYLTDLSREGLRLILAEYDARGAAIERVRDLCAEQQVEAQGGGLTYVDTLYPGHVIEALDGESS